MKNKVINKKGIVLLSGGIDSTTTLFYVKKKGFLVTCLIFDYGQRHRRELDSAKKIADYAGVNYYLVKISLPWKGSSLLDFNLKIPNNKNITHNRIPSTYVPARNLIFLSYAVSLAEVINASYIFYGANQIDYSGYPDCRESFINAFQKVIEVGTRSSIEYKKIIKLKAPLINFNKSQIIELALKLKVPLELTWSCYKGLDKPCGKCDSCKIRNMGFKNLGIADPLNKLCM